MQTEIWSLGKENDAYIDAGVNLYFKKIRHYFSVELVVIPPPKKTAASTIDKIKLQEEEIILKKLQPSQYLVLLDETGKMLNSVQWAQQFQALMNMGTKTVVFLIGGAYGVSDGIKRRANEIWSLSPLVFPHQLVRLIVAEQIYRAASILNNLPYHHGERD
jgi:23S rRNA (pseudouridine1915-N3)-methyltransferase